MLSPSPLRLRRWARLVLLPVVASAVLAATATGCGPKPAAEAKGSPTPRPPFAPPKLAPAWTSPTATGKPFHTTLHATWHTGSALYVGRGSGVEILDAATGQSKGTVQPPEAGATLCAMTPTLSADGLGAVAWIKGDPEGRDASCEHVSLVDTRKDGAVVWTASVTGSPVAGKPFTNQAAALGWAGDVLAVMTPNTVVGLRKDRSQAWSWSNPGVARQDFVYNDDMAVRGDRITVMLSEKGAPAKPNLSFVTLDGKGRQTKPAAERVPLGDGTYLHLVSDHPEALLVTPPSEAAPELLLLAADGAVTRRITLTTPVGHAELRGIGTYWRPDNMFDIRFTDTTVFVTAGSTISDTPAHVAAFDLKTGAMRWSRPVEAVSVPRLVGADADAVYVLAGKTTSDMTMYAFTSGDGSQTPISSVAAPRTLLPVIGLAIDYRAGDLAMTETRAGMFGTLMYRAP
ncbi:hypothetical protein ACIQV2_29670 [Streptomyces globosus]|uniref:hypothetical protein n=1 Tax=Streptomyces globosus TaxID=68209 RepID=UPI0038104226